MKNDWRLILFFITQVIYVKGDIIEWRNTLKERTCFNSEGKRGICVPPKICGQFRSKSSPNDLFRYHCRSRNGHPMVCCMTRKWLSFQPSSIPPTSSSNLVSMASVVSDMSFSSPIESFSSVLSSTASLDTVSSASAASVSGMSSSNPIESFSSALSSTASPDTLSSASVASTSDISSSSPIELFSSALSSIASLDTVSSASAAFVSGTSSSSPMESSSRALTSAASPYIVSSASVASLYHISSSNPIELFSSALSSSASLDTVSSASGAPLNGMSSSNPIQSFSSALSSTASPDTVSSPSVASVSDMSFSAKLFSNVPLSTARIQVVPSAFPSRIMYKRSLDSDKSEESVRNKNSDAVQPLLSSLSSTTSPEKVPVIDIVSSNNNSSTENSVTLPLSSSNTTVEITTKIPSKDPLATTTSSPTRTMDDFASAFPAPPVCGVSQGSFSKVVGGTNASLGNFPWIGIIAYRASNGFTFKCGASLLTSQHSLTAAHCIVGFEKSIYFVRLGELDILDHSQNRPVDALVKIAIKHEKYDTKYLTDDIGILVFHRKVLFTDNIRPICLPLSETLRSKDFVDYTPFVAGWGRTGYTAPQATHLQMLQLPVVSEKSCREAYTPLELFIIDERVICAGGSGGKDACNGDSGGPLMQPIWDPINYTTYFYQTGVVSFGMKCGTPGFPTVFTRVTEYISWIQRHVLGPNAT